VEWWEIRLPCGGRKNGEPLRIPGELLTPSANPVDPALLITELRQHMAHPRAVPAARHASPATFVHSRLLLSGVRTQGSRPWCPHRAAPSRSSHGEIRRYEACHRVNRQCQASLHSQWDQTWEQHEPTSHSNPCHSTACHATTAPNKNWAVWSPHHFPFNILAYISAGCRGGGLWCGNFTQSALLRS
jgi:hypothetical protein